MTDWFHLHLFGTKLTLDVLYMYILKTKFIYLKERSISFVLVLLSNWPLSMSGLSFWYFFVSLHAYLTILPFVNVEFLFLLLCFFFKKEKIVLMFPLFSCCWVGLFMKWSVFVKRDIKHANKCVRVHLTTGGVFLFIHVFDIFQLPAISIAVSPFFHFLCGFAVFLILQCPPP